MKRPTWKVALFGLGIVLLSILSAEAAAPSRLRWQGKDYFVLGANYPFYNGLRGVDIGRLSTRKDIVFFSIPVEGGRHNKLHAFPPLPPGGTGFNAMGLDKQFEDMYGVGIRALRWMWGWDGRDFYDLDEHENCHGMSVDVFAHLDQILSLAEKHRIYLIPVLLDFRFVSGDAPRRPARRLRYRDGSTEPPHGEVIRNPHKRKMFIDNCIKPLVHRYKDSNQIIIWEIMNEAGNVVYGRDNKTGYVINAGLEVSEDRRIHIHVMQEFFNEVYDAIKGIDQKHYILASGLGRPKQLPMLVGRVKSDLYGAHYKDDGTTHFGKVESVNAIQKQILDPYSLKMDKPLLMTESTAKLRTHLDYYVDSAYRGGWAGILVWTYYQLIGYHEFNHHKEIVTSKDNKGIENVKFFQNWQKEHYSETEIGQ